MNTTSNLFRHDIFSSLPDFEQNRNFSKSRLDDVRKLGDILIKYKQNNMFGVCLLHKHFTLQQDELMVESVTETNSTILPTKNADNNAIAPYMWKAHQSSSGKKEYFLLEFVTNSSITNDQIQSSKTLLDNREFLTELSDKIFELTVQDIFGIALFHRQKINFDRDTQTLLETDAGEERMLKVSPVNKDRAASGDWTQTLWKFEKNGKMEGVNGCDLHGCAGHCGHEQEYCCY